MCHKEYTWFRSTHPTLFKTVEIVDYYDGMSLGLIGSDDDWRFIKLLSSSWLHKRYFLMVRCPSHVKEMIDTRLSPSVDGHMAKPNKVVYREVVNEIDLEINRQLEDLQARNYIVFADSHVTDIELVVLINNELTRKAMDESPNPSSSEDSTPFWQRHVAGCTKVQPAAIGWAPPGSEQ